MLSKSDLEQLALTWCDEANCLFAAGYYSGAYCVGGYAVELALKACIAALFKYLIQMTTHDGFSESAIRLVTDRKTPEVRLRREKSFPNVDTTVRFNIVDRNDAEASRVLDYARRLGGPPVIIQNAMWKGLFIEFALVASIPQADFAVA